MTTNHPVLNSILGGLSEDQRTVFLQILQDRSRPAEHVAHVLAVHGYRVSASTIRTYRRAVEREKEMGK